MKYLAVNLVLWSFFIGFSLHGQQKNALEGNWYDNFSRVGLQSAASYALGF